MKNEPPRHCRADAGLRRSLTMASNSRIRAAQLRAHRATHTDDPVHAALAWS
jgi:hypothetical protein